MAPPTGRTNADARVRRWLVRIALVAGLLFVATIPGERRAVSSAGARGIVAAFRVADGEEAAP